jgi:hypothetical protein
MRNKEQKDQNMFQMVGSHMKVLRACLGLLHSLFFNSAPFHTCQILPTPAALLLEKTWSWGKLHQFGGATK